MINNYQTYLVKYEIKEEFLDKLTEWSNVLNNNRLEVLQSLENENVVFEIAFVDGNCLYYFFKAENVEEVFSVFSKSKLFVDNYHSKILKSCLKPDSQIIKPLLDIENNLKKFLKKPLAISFGYQETDSFSFITTKGVVKIGNFNLTILTEFLKLSNGLNTIKSISKTMNIDILEIFKLYSRLDSLNIVVDSCSIYKWFHQTTKSDAVFKLHLSPPEISLLKHPLTKNTLDIDNNLLKDIGNRDSVRYFTGELHDLNQILEFVKATYYSGKFWIPSGGGIYPLSIMIVKKELDFTVNIYRFDIYKQVLELIKKCHCEYYYNAFNDSQKLSKSSFAVVICADMTKHPYKYSNKGYKLTCLEAGHLAQNFYLLASTHDNLDIYEYCGYDDNALGSILKLNTNYEIITSIICGFGSVTKSVDMFSYDKLYYLIDRYQYKTKLITKLIGHKLVHDEDYLGREIASTVYKDSLTTRTGFGYGITKEEAGIKSIVEALERYFCSFYNSDINASYNELKSNHKIINPLDLVGYDSEYFDQDVANYLHRYLSDELYDWVFGYNLLDEEVKTLVHSDLVYYPIARFVKNRKPCFHGNSTGVAGHYSKELVIKNAVCELIERDSIAVFWYTNYQFSIIPVSDLPTEIVEKLDYWKKYDRDFIFVNATVDYLPVVICFQVSKTSYPFCLAGAACDEDIGNAIKKSFGEAEFATISWQQLGLENVNLTEIRRPDQHGIYYAGKENSQIIKEILNNLKEKKIGTSFVSFESVLQRINPIIFEIKRPEDEWDIWVVRAISEHLLPLNFGYRLGAINHNRIKYLNLKVIRNINEPHFFP